MFNCLTGIELINVNKQLCLEAAILTTVNAVAKITQESHIKAITSSAEEHIQPAETSIRSNKNKQCYRPEVRSSLSSGLN